MIHRARVSGWAPILATAFESLLAWWAALIYYTLAGDPYAWKLAQLAAVGSGAFAWLVFYSLWQGITLNVGNCPAAAGLVDNRPRYTDLNKAESIPVFAATAATIYQDADGFNWMLNYPTRTWRAVARVIDGNLNKFPYRQSSKAGIGREEWETLRDKLITANLAVKLPSGIVIINQEGARVIHNRARTPLLRQDGG